MSHYLHVAIMVTIGAAGLACASSPSPTTPDRTAAAPVIVALGDSLTAGPGLRREEAYPARLQERIRSAGLPHVVVNEGISGDTTAGALARLERALRPDTAILIVALGANDGLRGVPVEAVDRNLRAIVDRARERGVRVLLCGMETPPTKGWDYTLAFHRIYPGLAQAYGAPLMPFLLAGVVGRAELNLPDGWHPNAAGMDVIATNMWPYLEPMLR